MNPYSKSIRKNKSIKNKKLTQNKIFKLPVILWVVPVLISGYLLYKSPNLINEIKNNNDNSAKKEKLKSVLKEIQTTPKEIPQPNENTNVPSTDSTPKSEEISKQPNKSDISDKEDQEKSSNTENKSKFTLYFTKISNNNIQLSPVSIKLGSNSDLIKDIVNNLINKPDNLSDQYRSIIPKGTKLISYNLNKSSLTLNFNENFLNDQYGMDGKKLKIAQLVNTLTKIHNIKQVLFEINGKQVKYLDRDGLIKNTPFHKLNNLN